MILTRLPVIKKPPKPFNLLYLDDHEYLISTIDCGLRSKEFEREQGKMHLTTRSLYFQPNSHRIALLKFKLNSFEFSFASTPVQTESSFNSTSRNSKFRTETNSPKYQSRRASDKPTFVINVKRFTLVTRDKISPAYSQTASERFEFETSQQDLNRLAIELDMVLRYSDEEGFVNIIFGVRYKELTEIIQNSEEFDSDEVIIERKVTRLMFEGVQLGAFFMTNRSLHFYGLINAVPDNTVHLMFKNIVVAVKYKHLHKDNGISIFTYSAPVLFIFETQDQRDSIYDFLLNKLRFRTAEQELPKMTEKWRKGQISNFEYLMFINHISNRSILDSAQYPVFPWTLKNFHSKGQEYLEISLSLANNFRDLSKPIGALNEARLMRYQARCQEQQEDSLYPICYSNTTTVFYYLIRKYPEIILRQQNSIFTTSDKIFESIEKCFGSSLNNFADLKELVPEFYSRDPEFLVNHSRMEVSGNKALDHVELPEWSSSFDEFSGTMRAALESDLVSDSLHLWIDLIFGIKQNSLEDFNNFSPECYEMDRGGFKSDLQKASADAVLKEYGIVPSKVFHESHPQKILRIFTMPEINREITLKLQRLTSQVQNLTMIHTKEFKAQEKQYKQLLVQETQEKNAEIMALKAEYATVKDRYAVTYGGEEAKRKGESDEGKLQYVRSLEGSLKDRKNSQKKLQKEPERLLVGIAGKKN